MNRLLSRRAVRYCTKASDVKETEKKDKPVKQEEKQVGDVAEKKLAVTENAESGKVGILSQVMASLMKPDVRAAYECSLMPPDKQLEFLQHIREMDNTERQHELQKKRDYWVSEVELAKVKAQAALDEIKQKSSEQEQLNAADHLRHLDVLAKKTEQEKVLASSKWRHQKWRAVAEREKRLTMKAEEARRKAEHKATLERMAAERENRIAENQEVLKMEEIRHKQAMELEAAKASAAKERLKENRAAVEMGPNEDIKAQREHEVQLEEGKKEEREKQRKHEWDLHTARLQDAEDRARGAQGDGTSQARADIMWRFAQFTLGLGTLVAVYDWETKKIAERTKAREDETARQLAAQSSEETKQKAEYAVELEKAKAKHDAEVQVASLSAKQAAEDLAKSKIQLETVALQVRQEEASIKAANLRLEQIETIRKHLSTAFGMATVFTLMVGLGGSFGRDE